MKVKRLANAAGVALPLDATAQESLDGVDATGGVVGGANRSVLLDEDEDQIDLDEFIQQMMQENGAGGEGLLGDDMAQLPLAVPPEQQQQHQFFTGQPLQAPVQSLLSGQANGYAAEQYRFHGNYAGQPAGGQILVTIPASQQQQQQTAGTAASTMFPLSGPQSLSSEFMQQHQQVAQVSQQLPVSGIRAAINLRKRPLPPQQQQIVQDLTETDFAVDTKPSLPLLQQQKQKQATSSVGGDSAATMTDVGGGGDSNVEDRSERKRLKNAQLARENREKKKQHVHELESRVRELETALAGSREREASLSNELSSAKRHNNYLLSVLYRQSELASFLSTVPALVSRERRLQLQQPQQATTRDTDSQTSTGGICLHLDNAETISVLLCDKCATLGTSTAFSGATQPSSLASNSSMQQQQSL